MTRAFFEGRSESTDGSRPEPSPLDKARARAFPISAFRILEGGDAFDGGRADPKSVERATAWAEEHLRFERGAPKEARARTTAEAARLLSGNPALVERMRASRPIHVDIVPTAGSFIALGFPPSTNERASGLFWDHPSWPEARIALREEHLFTDEVLVVHEVAHAVHAMAFTELEREAVYRVLRPTFIDRSSMDEAFAIYTEREMCKDFSVLEKKAPGIYGFVRRQWHEDHLFTRFVRKLWFPHKPLAGPKLPSTSSWKKFSGS